MIKQDRNAGILIGGDINGQLENLHSQLAKIGFRAGLEQGSLTHRDGGMLDQIWARNLIIKNALISESQDPDVTDHSCIKVTVGIPTATES